MAASPGGGAGAAYFLLKPAVRALVHQARTTATQTANNAKTTILHNQLKQLPRSAHYAQHTSFNLRKQVQRLVRAAWEGVARPIPAGQAGRTVAFPSSMTSSLSRIPTGQTSTISLLNRYAQTISSAFTRASPAFPRGASLTAQLGIRPSPSQAFAYARLPGGGSAFGFETSAAARARAMQASSRLGGGSAGGRNFSTGAGGKVLREISNVPIGMRALADRLRDGDEKAAERKAGRIGARKPYERKANALAGGRALGSPSSASRFSGSIGRTENVKDKATKKAQAMEAYFPVASGSQVPMAISTDLSLDTYLLIPLCPSLSDLLNRTGSPSSDRGMDDPHPSVPYLPRPTPSVPNLLNDVLPAHTAFSSYTNTRVHPLLHRLGEKGVFQLPSCLGDGRAKSEILFAPSNESEGLRPDALRLLFEGVTEQGVRELIGDNLGKEWHHVYSVPRRTGGKGLSSSSPSIERLRMSAEPGSVPQRTSEESAWRMPVLDAAGSTGAQDLVLSPALSTSMWSETEQEEQDSCSDTSLSPQGSISPIDMTTPSSSTFNVDFDIFSVQLDEYAAEIRSQATLDGASDVELTGWTDAEMEFSDEEEVYILTDTGFILDLSELGEEEQLAWADELSQPVTSEGVTSTGDGINRPGLYLV